MLLMKTLKIMKIKNDFPLLIFFKMPSNSDNNSIFINIKAEAVEIRNEPVTAEPVTTLELSPNNSNNNAPEVTCRSCALIFYYFLIFINLPIIICDLYYGFNSDVCDNNKMDALNFTPKEYLIVSGFIRIGFFALMLNSILNFSTDANSDLSVVFCCSLTFTILSAIFMIIWDILGAIVFWASAYNQGHCNGSISTYIFAALIIKLTTVWLSGGNTGK